MTHKAFEAALDEHRGIVARVAAMYARTPEDRRDLAQEIALQLWRAYPRFDPARAKLSTWMYRIALNVAISRARKPDRTEPLEDHHHPAAPPADPDLATLHRAIAAFSPIDRALLLLHLDDRPTAEIADVLGMSPTNVTTKLSRLRDDLREGLG